MNDQNGRRPRVTVHYAQTLDGRIATRTGHAQTISCEASFRLQHELRATHDAVLVGVGTALADDPRLTVRLVEGRSPLRVVVDSTLRIPLDRRLLTDGAAPTLIATTDRARPDRVAAVAALGADVVTLPRDGCDRVDLTALFEHLARRGVASLMIEGGGAVITSVLRERLVDRLVVAIAPKMVGKGVDAVHDLDIRRMGDALTFTEARFEPLDADVIFEGTVVYGDADAGPISANGRRPTEPAV
jgi:5-amino-6-(5-phosphoribosylamino)uracil reductase/diaminohydroxyphosphoribosylaminopyrimidine deaminase/5-amino-6-(5-phosphoribosylamino)uracil reductase